MRKKRILILSGVFLALLAATYFARFWLFEGVIIRKAQVELQALLGAQVQIGGVRGNWITRFEIRSVTIRGAKGSAYREIRDVDLEVEVGLWSLLRGNLSGLEKVKAHGRRVELDTEGNWTAPTTGTDSTTVDGPGLTELLALLGNGGSVRVDELVLHPAYVKPGPVTVKLEAGATTRTATVKSATIDAKGSIDTAGAFRVDVTGTEAGRVLQALSIKGANNPEGGLRSSLEGTTTTGDWRSELDLRSTIGVHPVEIRCQLARRDQRYFIPEVVAVLPGIQFTTKNLVSPAGSWSPEALLRALDGSEKAVVDVQIADLTRYQNLLPAALLPHLPILGELHAEAQAGTLNLRASTLRGKTFRLDIASGSITLPEGNAQGTWRQARAKDLKVELTLNDNAAVETTAGRASATGTVSAALSGTLAQPEASGRVQLKNLRFADHEAAAIAAEWTFDGQIVDGRNLEITALRMQRDGRKSGPVDLAGSATYALPSGEQPPRVSCDLRGPLAPLLDLGWPEATETFRNAATPGSIRARAALALGSGTAAATIPSGTVTLDLTDLRFAPMRPIAVTAIAEIAPERIEVRSLTAQGDAGELAIQGEIDLSQGTLDLTSRGSVTTLQPLMRVLGQPDLEGAVTFKTLRVQGPWARPTTVGIDTEIQLTSIAEPWLERLPARLRTQLPAAPFELQCTGTHRPESTDLESFRLDWGDEKRRIRLDGAGPIPLRIADDKLRAAPRDLPLVLNLRTSTDQPLPNLPLRRLDTTATISIRHDRIEVPSLAALSQAGSLRGQNLRVDLSLDALLENRIDLRTLQVAGGLVLQQFEIGPLLRSLQETPDTPRTEVAGTLTGELAISGPLIRPSVLGSLRLRNGRLKRPDAPALDQIEGTAEFAASKVSLDLTAVGANRSPVRVVAQGETRNATLTEAALTPTIPIEGQIRLEQLDLALLQPLLPDLPNLTGKASLTGTIRGTSGDPKPDLRLAITDAAWQLRSVKERIERVEIGLRVTDDVVRLYRCEGFVPTLDLRLNASGELEVIQGRLLDLRSGDPKIRCNLQFADVPLDLIPRRGGLEAARGTASGDLEVRGPLSDLQPKLKATIRNAAFKIDQVPRIEKLSATVEGNKTRLTLTGAAQMGAGPIRLTGDWTAGKGSLFEGFRNGTIRASLNGTRVLLARTGGLKLRGDVKLSAEGPIQAVVVSGMVTLANSRFTKRLSLVPDLKVTSGAMAGSPFGPWGIPGASSVRVDVRVQTSEPIDVRTNVLDTKLGLNCRLVGTGSAMHLEGDCNAIEGTLRFPGMAMRVASLRLIFSKADPTRPKLLATASGTRHGIQIDLQVRGPWDDPVVSMSSVPALQARELWSLVTTGVRPATLSTNSAGSNTAILATYVIQELLLTYFASESTEASESLVARFSFEFGRELSRNGAETWEVNLDVGGLWVIPKNFGLRFERDVYEDFNMGVVYRWRF